MDVYMRLTRARLVIAYLVLLVGMWLSFAPFIFWYLHLAECWGDIAVGCVIGSVTIARLVGRDRALWLNGVDLMYGVLLVAVASTLGRVPMAERIDDIAVGLVVVLLGASYILISAGSAAAFRSEKDIHARTVERRDVP
jgi:hypothetical protein